MKQLIILRSISGAGKSTFANFLSESIYGDVKVFEADKFMVENGEYKFFPSKLGYAHNQCRTGVEKAMNDSCPVIILSNTSTTEKEIQPYLDLALNFNYIVTSLIVENRHGNKDIHGLNEETLSRQEKRLKESIKLR